MRKTQVTDKQAENYVITNLNDAYSEPTKEIQHILVLSRSYINKTIAVNFQDLKKCFEEKYI